jgi:DNA polymerase-3 subunit epsilon
VRPRERLLAPRLTAAEIEAHRAFVATLGTDALWLRY